MHAPLISLDDPRALLISRVGGKAASLAHLRQTGFCVPDGFVLPHTEAMPGDETLRSAAAALEGGAARYAVRSSALSEDGKAHSHAGMFDTILNVPPQELAASILWCRRSASSERVQSYRECRAAVAGEIGLSVLVQPMIDAALAGVCFTIDPVTGAQELVVEVAPGLGDHVVGGTVTPTLLRVAWSEPRVIAAESGDEAPPIELASDPIWLQQLHETATTLARRAEGPLDIEFAVDHARRVWVLQCRPVTAVGGRGS